MNFFKWICSFVWTLQMSSPFLISLRLRFSSKKVSFFRVYLRVSNILFLPISSGIFMLVNIWRNSLMAKMFFLYKKNFSNSASSVPDGLYSSKALLTSLISGRTHEAFLSQISSSESSTFLSLRTALTLLHNLLTYSQTVACGKYARSYPRSLLKSTYKCELINKRLGWNSYTKC